MRSTVLVFRGGNPSVVLDSRLTAKYSSNWAMTPLKTREGLTPTSVLFSWARQITKAFRLSDNDDVNPIQPSLIKEEPYDGIRTTRPVFQDNDPDPYLFIPQQSGQDME